MFTEVTSPQWGWITTADERPPLNQLVIGCWGPQEAPKFVGLAELIQINNLDVWVTHYSGRNPEGGPPTYWTHIHRP